MLIRTATLPDVPQMQIIRNAVKENRLSNPALVSNADYTGYLTLRGKGWVAEADGVICGFAIADLQGRNVWALFVHPGSEAKGIGKALHHAMLHWYFAQTSETIWLGTAPHTRAAEFYRRQGWVEVGTNGSKELKFEMSSERWSEVAGR